MRVDLHVHTSGRSMCSHATADEMVRAGIMRGLGALVITDHGKFAPAAELRNLNEKHAPFRVFGGIEVGTAEGEHALVIGVDDPFLEERSWPWARLHGFVRERGGLLVLAHPFRFRDEILANIVAYPPDAMELCSSLLPVSSGKGPKVREAATQAGIKLVCDSDAHETKPVGFYYNDFQREPVDDVDLVATIKAGEYTFHVVHPRAFG